MLLVPSACTTATPVRSLRTVLVSSEGKVRPQTTRLVDIMEILDINNSSLALQIKTILADLAKGALAANSSSSLKLEKVPHLEEPCRYVRAKFTH